MVKRNTNATLLHLEPPVERTADHQVRPAILTIQCPTGEALPHVLLVPGMNVLGCADIVENGHPGAGKAQGETLCVLQFCPGTQLPRPRCGGLEVRQLREVKGYFFRPAFAPVRDQQWKKCLILLGPPRIRLSLIPDGPPYSVASPRVDHSIVNRPRTVRAQGRRDGLLGLPGELLSLRGIFLHPVGTSDLFPGGHLLFVGGLGCGEIKPPHLRIQFLQEGPAFGFIRQGLPAGKRLRRLAAPGGSNNPYRHTQLPVELQREIVAYRRELPHAFRSGDTPLPSHATARTSSSREIGEEHSEPRMIGSRNVLCSPLGGREGPLHVGLPRGHPYLAHEDIFNRNPSTLTSGRNESLPLCVGIQRGQLNSPHSFNINLSMLDLSRETHFHLFPGSAPTPHRHRFSTLENRVATKHPRQFNP